MDKETRAFTPGRGTMIIPKKQGKSMRTKFSGTTGIAVGSDFDLSHFL